MNQVSGNIKYTFKATISRNVRVNVCELIDVKLNANISDLVRNSVYETWIMLVFGS